MNINWNEHEIAAPGELIPAKTWVTAQCIKITKKLTSDGDEMFAMKFSVISGPYKNRHYQDNIVFSEKGLSRAKLICDSMGIDVTGSVSVDELEKSLLGREVQNEIIISKDGKYNNVSYAGYKKVEIPF